MAEFIKKNCVAVATPGGNNLWVQSASGKVLKSHFGELPTKGLAEFNQLPETDRKPARLEPSKTDNTGRGPPPPGTLVLRTYICGFEKGSKGELLRIADIARQRIKQKGYTGPGDAALESGPQRDFLWLTAAEWKVFVPAQPSKGQKLLVPAALAQRLACFYLYDYTTGLSRSWSRADYRSGELTLVVEETSSAAIALRLEGTVRLADNPDIAKATRRAEFRLLGYLHYDRQTKGFDRFDVAALGEYHSTAANSSYKYPLVLGSAFELALSDSVGYGTPPGVIRDGDRGQLTGYFGGPVEKIEAGVLRYFGLVK
jgi:hypothetical protein